MTIDGIRIRAHRISWKINVGDIAESLCVLHRCDNPICVRPSHLFVGTYIDNNADKMTKGRFVHGSKPKGENNPIAKLRNEDIPIIRARRAAGETYKAIAADYDISFVNIRRACTGENWKSFTDGPIAPIKSGRGEGHGMSKLNEEAVRTILREQAAGSQLQPLADRFGVSKQVVWAVVHRKTWRHVEA